MAIIIGILVTFFTILLHVFLSVFVSFFQGMHQKKVMNMKMITKKQTNCWMMRAELKSLREILQHRGNRRRKRSPLSQKYFGACLESTLL